MWVWLSCPLITQGPNKALSLCTGALWLLKDRKKAMTTSFKQHLVKWQLVKWVKCLYFLKLYEDVNQNRPKPSNYLHLFHWFVLNNWRTYENHLLKGFYWVNLWTFHIHFWIFLHIFLEKRLRYDKWHKKWTENQWLQVLWRDESSSDHLGICRLFLGHLIPLPLVQPFLSMTTGLGNKKQTK